MQRTAGLILACWSGVRWVAEGAIIFLSLAMVASAMAQVVARYVFNAPLVWSEELSRYLFIWLAFLAAWLAWRRREHLGIEVLAEAMPPRAGWFLRRVVEVTVVFFAVASMYYGQRILTVSANQPSAVLRIPMVWVYAAFYAGMTLIVIETFAGWLARLAGRETEVRQ